MTLTDYSQTIDYLFNRTNFERSGTFVEPLKLDNVLLAAAQMGNVHDGYPSIHVAGTNGKGSVSHCLCAVLQQCGYKVGLFTSPHLVDFCERIKIDGQPCSQAFVVEFVCQHKEVIEHYGLSFFEVTTLMAFAYFALHNVDFAVIETGLGGRLDATNIITPVLSVITNVGLEHTEILGNTVALIAVEKGGIIKNDVPAIYGGKDGEVMSVLAEIAYRKGVELIVSREVMPLEVVAELPALVLKITGELWAGSEVVTDLKGRYQVDNIGVTLTACAVLMKSGVSITKERVMEGLRKVRLLTGFLGRWQTVCCNPTVIVDVAHNADGIAAIKPMLAQLSEERLTVIFGVVRDKDIGSMLRQLPPRCELIVTPVASSRSAQREDIEPFIKRGDFLSVRYVCDVRAALDSLLSYNVAGSVTVVVGSNYLAGEVLQYFE